MKSHAAEVPYNSIKWGCSVAFFLRFLLMVARVTRRWGALKESRADVIGLLITSAALWVLLYRKNASYWEFFLLVFTFYFATDLCSRLF